jgi:DNA polymerase/3'-5' exonuclease PolX
MPVSFGAITFGVTAPSGYLQESSQETAVELASIRDADGQTVVVQAKPRSTTTTTVKTKGEDDLLVVPEGAFATGTAKLTGSKVSQTNDDFTTSEATYTLFE